MTAQPTQCRDALGVEWVEVLIDLVEVVEWAWLVILNRENQSQCGHRLLAAGKIVETGFLTFPRGYAVHFQAALEGVLRVLHAEFAAACRLQYLIDSREIIVDVLEHCHQSGLPLILELHRYRD